ncbi:MAG TPA: LLM class F420-dependent oxidoreductase [Actinocrinis sp.]|uniref:LLM class F420-dependent oxidoreductase n=1 Tax=Actinocrinis sp. TaxID=1920516 RepID=UPI002DDD9503|nr:LLM class F420-dependent oxidoreductase [Actinocrinis sp.]HEV2344519.1 LLM class F420-dependent oxidoreductase [Actinocrinis sp.]
MGNLRFGIKVSQGVTIDTLRQVWRIADEAGFDHCWNMDHFASLGGDDTKDIFEAWTTLAGMAALTTRVRIGCSVTGNTYRHPGVLAKMAVTVDHLSGGRLEFGLGAAWAENEHTMLGLPFGTAGDRADRFEEALKIITSLWTEPTTTFNGKHYQLKDAIAEPKPVQRPHPPIWIGGAGPKRTLRLAAEYADVWNAPGGEPALVAESSAILDRHCADIGRDPAQIRRSVQIRFDDDADALLRTVEEFAGIGVTEPLLVVNGGDVAARAQRLAELLPRLRSIGSA